MNTEWTQDEMFPVPSGVWVQIGLSISGEEQEIACYVKGSKKVWPYQFGERSSRHNYTENGLQSAFEEVWTFLREQDGYTGLKLKELHYERNSAPF